MAKNILIVDDDAQDRELMRELLKKAKYDATAVKNGAQALAKIQEEDFDMILIDVLMPTLSGYDLLLLLREKLNHKIPMVYVTILPESEVHTEQADGFIHKPFIAKDFIDTINKIFKTFKKR